MGEMMNLKDFVQAVLWIDSETSYEVKSYELVGKKKSTIKAVLERIKPFPHLINDEWIFSTTVNGGDIMVDLDFYTQHQPAEDEE
jgi:hypothetical protein